MSRIVALDARSLAENWWAIALRGVVAIIFGLVTFVFPGLSLIALIFVFGAYAIVEGIFNVIAAVRGRSGEGPRWILMFAPGAGALALILWIGAYAVVFGAVLIALAFRLRRWRGEDHVPMARAA